MQQKFPRAELSGRSTKSVKRKYPHLSEQLIEGRGRRLSSPAVVERDAEVGEFSAVRVFVSSLKF